MLHFVEHLLRGTSAMDLFFQKKGKKFPEKFRKGFSTNIFHHRCFPENVLRFFKNQFLYSEVL